MSVRASVSPTVVLKFESNLKQVSISEEDVARGYIDLPGTFLLTINSGKTAQNIVNILVDYEPHPSVFKSIEVAARPQADDLLTGDSAIAKYIDQLPPTASGPSRQPLKGMEGDKKFESAAGSEPVSSHGSVTSLSYRLVLADKVIPGNVSVPLTLSLQL